MTHVTEWITPENREARTAQPVRPVVLLVLTAVLIAAGSTARAGRAWEVRRLASPGRISQHFVADLTGDGRPEIGLVSGRRLIIHHGEAGSPTTSFTFEPTALVFCLGDVDTDPKTLEIVFLRKGGIAYYAACDGRVGKTPHSLVASEEGIVTWGQADDVHQRTFVSDVDGDDRDDLVFPTRTGYRLILGGPHDKSPRFDPARASVIPYALRVSIGLGGHGLLARARYVEGIPAWTAGDFDGDGSLDFALLPAGRIVVHRGNGKGFSPEADFWLDLSEMKGALGLVHPEIHDVNRDGIPDLMANEPWHGRTTIYLGRKIATKGRVKLPPPAMTRRVGGWSWEPRLEDLNGDGFPDFVLPTTERIGALEAAAIAVTGRLGVRNLIYLNTRDPLKPYADEPDAIRGIEVSIRLSLNLAGKLKVGHTKIANTATDFDGDGRTDLLLQTDDAVVEIYQGSEKGVIAESAWKRVAIPSTADALSTGLTIDDLNGDGVPDMILHYEAYGHGADEIVLLVSRKE
jgi:FG-GAP-like repeat